MIPARDHVGRPQALDREKRGFLEKIPDGLRVCSGYVGRKLRRRRLSSITHDHRWEDRADGTTLTVDEPGRRVFVSHETQVEVIDLASNSVSAKIPDTPGVHGIALAHGRRTRVRQQRPCFHRHNFRLENTCRDCAGAHRQETRCHCLRSFHAPRIRDERRQATVLRSLTPPAEKSLARSNSAVVRNSPLPMDREMSS